MKVPIEDDYNYDSKLILEECRREKNPEESFDIDRTILEVNYNEVIDEETYSQKYIEFYNEIPKEEQCVKSNIKGKITVTSKLGELNGASISSAKINLYVLNGLSPKLIESKLTDETGVVVFEELEAGSYRIIAIVDRKYFEKPTYISWNEVNLDRENSEAKIIVVNKIRNNIKK